MKHWRINLIAALFIIFAAVIIFNLATLQLANYKFWRALAFGQQNKLEGFSQERGDIFLAGSDFPVATNRDSFFVYLSPVEIKDDEKVAESLNKIINIGQGEIMKKLADKENQFAAVKYNINDEEIKSIKEARMSGVYVGQRRERFYPQENLAAHILGFVDADGNGQYGTEGYYNDALSGKNDVNRDAGSDLNLGIDYNIQFMAEKLLMSAGKNLEAQSGQIIVMDPHGGGILAMAEYPSFNPNRFSDYAKNGNLGIFQNASTQKIFEPGSVLKPITMAIAIEKDKITPQTTYTDEGFVKFGSYTIYNYDGRKYGKQTMTQVLEKSINTGAVFVEEKIPHNVFLDYLQKFGFFEKTGIDLTEIYSENKELKKGYEINFATASFGQGIEMTPIQLVRAFAAIANGGRLVRPYLAGFTEAQFSEPVISSKTASQVTAMMVSVVENGYGKAAKIPGYYIAGKTGTAQMAEGGQYAPNKTTQSFIGFAPAFDAKFIILVKLDNPKTKTAEYSAAPVFRDLAKYIINLWQIEPDH